MNIFCNAKHPNPKYSSLRCIRDADECLGDDHLGILKEGGEERIVMWGAWYESDETPKEEYEIYPLR